MFKQIGEIILSNQWSDDPWYLNQDNREFINNEARANCCNSPTHSSTCRPYERSLIGE